jgi:hypothetical protein
VILIVDVPALRVSVPALLIEKAELLEVVTVKEELPRVSAFVPDPEALKLPVETVTLFVSSVPAVKLITPVFVSASCRVHVPPEAEKEIKLAKEIPLQVTDSDEEELNVMLPVYVRVIPAVPPDKFMSPVIFKDELPAHVTFPARGAPIVKF